MSGGTAKVHDAETSARGDRRAHWAFVLLVVGWGAFEVIATSDGATVLDTMLCLCGCVLFGGVAAVAAVLAVVDGVRRRRFPWGGLASAVIGLGIVTLVFASLTSDLSVRARFSMSRQAFDVAARNALEGKSLRTPTRIGYFRVTEIDRAGKSVRFVIGEYGLADSIGVAYSPGGEPPVVGEDYYYDLGGPWWLWIRSW